MPITAPQNSQIANESNLCTPPSVDLALGGLATTAAAPSVDFAPWLPIVLGLAWADRMEDAIDRMFEEVDQWLRDGHFRPCNRLLEMPAGLFPLKLSVSLLALTKSAAERLPARKFFLEGTLEMVDADGPGKKVILGECFDRRPPVYGNDNDGL